MRILVALPGIHRVHRGAEVALEAIAEGLAQRGHDVTAVGSGTPRDDVAYAHRRLPYIGTERFERWPRVKPMRGPDTWSSLAFMPGLLATYRPGHFDVTLTCGFPFENLALRRRGLRQRTPHVFVTQNGDWPATNSRGEARLFGCDGLVCTNPVYLERNRDRWNCALIPNGADMERFSPGPPAHGELDLPSDRPLILMVSALIESKRVEAGIRAVADVDANLLVAGDGPLRVEVRRLGEQLLGERFILRTFRHEQMPLIYRTADVLMHTTLLESFGNVYVEAMATGLPVVAHDSAATRWILGASPSLVDTTDQAKLTGAVEAAIRNGRDAGSTQRVADARSRFAWPSIGESYDEFLTTVVARPRAERTV